MPLHSNFYSNYNRKKHVLTNLRNRNKNLWENGRFLFNRENNKIFSKNNDFFEGFYLYRLKRFLNFFKFFLYNRYSNNFNSTVYKDFNSILVEYNKFFTNTHNVSFLAHLSRDNFNLSYNFSYVQKEKFKLRTLYNIKKYKLFIKKIRGFFSNNKSDFNRLLINYLEFQLAILVYRAKFVNSIYSSEQLIKHGFFEVDGKIISKPSYQLKLNETVQLIPTYNLYLKKQKLGFLLQSFVSWYSGYYHWFNKQSNYMDNFFSLLLINYLIRSKRGLVDTRMEVSSGNLFGMFYKEDGSSVKTNYNTFSSFDRPININNSIKLFTTEIFNLILPNLRLVFRSLVSNYLNVNNKFMFIVGPNSLSSFYLDNASSIFFPFTHKKDLKIKKFKFKNTFRNRRKNRLFLLNLKKRYSALSKLYSNIYSKNRFNFSFYLPVNIRNFGFNSYKIKFNSFRLNYNMTKIRFIDWNVSKFLNKGLKQENRLDLNNKTSYFKNFLKELSPLDNYKMLYFFSKESIFISKYYNFLLEFLNSSSDISLCSINKLINLLLNKNFILSILFNTNYKDFIALNNSIDLNSFNFYSKNLNTKNNRFPLGNLVRGSGLLLQQYLLFNKSLNSSYLNKIVYNKNKVINIITQYKSSLFNFKWFNTSKLNLVVTNKVYGFNVTYNIVEWLKIRNLNLRFKKFILYFFFIENINLLKDYSSYKNKNKNFIIL